MATDGPLSASLLPSATYVGDHMHLTQTKYALDLLARTKFTDAKPISTPIPAGHKLSAYVGDPDPYKNPEQCRSVVGALHYLTITRPDLSYVKNQVCQLMHSPKDTHWMTMERILCYLKAAYNHGLVYKPSIFSDADYAGDPDTRHSTGVFKDLHLHLLRPQIWCDNVSSIALTSNPVFHSRTKHLEVDYHYVHEKVIRRELQIRLVSKLPVVTQPVSLLGDVRPTQASRV
ncbi:unnamed protein product [Malus baccata var. baccata]